jgi:MFS family permease
MLWLLFIAMLTISYCLNSWLPTVLIQVGRDEQLAAISVSIFSFGGIAAALVIGLLIDRFGAGRTLGAFIGSSALLLAVLGQVLATAPVGALMVLLAASGFFALGAYGGINVILTGFYPSSLQATGIGWAKSVGRLGTVIAPIGIGAALAAGVGGQAVLSLFALPALVALVALVAVARRMPKDRRES